MYLTKHELRVALEGILDLALKYLSANTVRQLPVFAVVFSKPSDSKIIGVSLPPLARDEFREWIQRLVTRKQIVGYCVVAQGIGVVSHSDTRPAHLWFKEHDNFNLHPHKTDHIIGYASAPDMEILEAIVINRDSNETILDCIRIPDGNVTVCDEADVRALKVEW